jgi:hypothetical protein
MAYSLAGNHNFRKSIQITRRQQASRSNPPKSDLFSLAARTHTSCPSTPKSSSPSRVDAAAAAADDGLDAHIQLFYRRATSPIINERTDACLATNT